MTRFRVAILFDSHTPLNGGSFSLISSILKGFQDISLPQEYEILLVSVGPKSHSLADLHFKPYNKFFRKFIKILVGISTKIECKLQTHSKLARFLKKFEVDIVFFLGVPAEITFVPYILTVWDLQHRTHPWFPEVGSHKAWKGRENYYRNVLSRAIAVIVGTPQGKKEVSSFYGVYEDNIYIIPHVIGESENVTSSDRSGPYIYPAQFWAHKNHLAIVKAVEILRDKFGLIVKVDFIGSDKGNLKFIQQVIRESNLENQITILGFVSEEKKIELYRSSRGLIYSSFSGPENLPPLEAYDAGIPVIYSDFPGAREQLGDFPFYFNPTDFTSLARIIEDVEKMEFKILRERLISQRDFLINKRPGNYADTFIDMIQAIRPQVECWNSRDFQNFD